MAAGEEAGVGPGVEPGDAAAHRLDAQLAVGEVCAVDVGDLELAARRRFERLGDGDDVCVVKVQARDGPVATGFCGFFLNRKRLHRLVEFDDAVALRVRNLVGEDSGAGLVLDSAVEKSGQVVAVEDVVAEDEADGGVADEGVANGEGLGDAFGFGLFAVFEGHAELAAVAEEVADHRQVARRGDDEHLADAGEHEDGERVVDGRLVIDGEELLAEAASEGVKPGAGAAC